MSKPLVFREAIVGDAECLSSLAIGSKAHWGYSAEFMNACVDELTVSRTCIENSDFYYVVAELDNEIIGFYELECLTGDEIELAALFVDPDHIGRGVGKALIEKAKIHASKLGASKLTIQSDPNAEKFYKAAGGVQTGTKESESIAGRLLPVFQISLSKESVE